MPRWITRLPDFRDKLKSFGKSYEQIKLASEFMIETLSKLESKIPKHIKDKFLDEKYINDNIVDSWFKLSMLIEETKEHFDFCKSLASNEITQSEWEDYAFNGDLVGLFNAYMNEFWDICDFVLNNKSPHDSNVEKFCWVEL